MNVDPRIQRYYDEAALARASLRRLAVDIAGRKFDSGAYSMHAIMVPEMKWAMENGRTDVAALIIELVDQYNNSSCSAAMMLVRLRTEAHTESVRQHEDGDQPEYLQGGEEEPPVLRLSRAEARAAFSSIEGGEE